MTLANADLQDCPRCTARLQLADGVPTCPACGARWVDDEIIEREETMPDLLCGRGPTCGGCCYLDRAAELCTHSHEHHHCTLDSPRCGCYDPVRMVPLVGWDELTPYERACADLDDAP